MTPLINSNYSFPVLGQIYALKRPYLEQFLEQVSQLFEVVVFTASQQVYADSLLNLIDTEKRWIQ